MTNQIVWVVGLGFSGSSLLNLLLDSQPEIRGIGEGAILYCPDFYEENAFVSCIQCNGICVEYEKWKGHGFYNWTFNLYPEAKVLVDTSKNPGAFFAKEIERDFEYKVIVLYKSPEQWAWSVKQHRRYDTLHINTNADVVNCFKVYRQLYQSYLWDTKDFDRIFVSYDQVIDFPGDTVAHICDWLGLDFDLGHSIWGTDTHMLGGNPGTAFQINPNIQIPEREILTYMDGRYSSGPMIQKDNRWISDDRFLAECDIAYSKINMINILAELQHETT